VSGVGQEVGNGIRSTIPRRFMDMAAQRGKSVRFCNRDACNADSIFDKSFDELGTQIRELVLHSSAIWCVTLEAGQSIDDASHDSRKKRFFAGKVRVNRRLTGRSQFCDLIDTRAVVTFLKKHMLGRVQDPRFGIAGEILGRPAETPVRSF
jgi:hypothetical protein